MLCPYCKKEIQDTSIKCNHCNEWFPSDHYHYPTDKKKSNFDNVFAFKLKDEEMIFKKHKNGKLDIFQNGNVIRKGLVLDIGKDRLLEIAGYKIIYSFKEILWPFKMFFWNYGFSIEITGKPLEGTSNDPYKRIKLIIFAYFVLAIKEFFAISLYPNPEASHVGLFLLLVILLLIPLVKRRPVFTSLLGSIYVIIDLIFFYTQAIETGYINRHLYGFIFMFILRGSVIIFFIQGIFAGNKRKQLIKKYTIPRYNK